MQLNQLRSLNTEKTYILRESSNCIVFHANPSLTKKDVVALLKERFSCDILSIRVLVAKGKKKRRKGVLYTLPNLKKFFVKVSDSSKIEGI